MKENQKAHRTRDGVFVEKTTLVSQQGATVVVKRLTLSEHGTRLLTSSSKGIPSGSTEDTQRQSRSKLAA